MQLEEELHIVEMHRYTKEYLEKLNEETLFNIQKNLEEMKATGNKH